MSADLPLAIRGLAPSGYEVLDHRRPDCGFDVSDASTGERRLGSAGTARQGGGLDGAIVRRRLEREGCVLSRVAANIQL
jgi:hypothetical protein